MSRFHALSLLITLLVCDNFEIVFSKIYKFKTLKKLSKSQVDVKAFLYPCTVADEIVLNSSSVTNSKGLHNCKRKLVIKMTVNSVGEVMYKLNNRI